MAAKASQPRRPRREPRRSSSGGLRRRLIRGAIWLVAVVAVGASTAFGLKSLESRVTTSEEAVAAPTTVRVRFSEVPSWLPWSQACRVASGIVGDEVDFNAPALTERAYERLAADPWVRSAGLVRKERCQDPLMGILEVQAVFREPLAIVPLKDGKGLAFVDEEAVRLPDDDRGGPARWTASVPASADRPAHQAFYWDKSEVPQGLGARQVNYVHVEGVAADAPAPGRKWEGADIADGVRLAKILRDKPYAEQVLSVDVRNHGGRVLGNSGRPHIVIHARGRSGESVDVWFGRFPAPRGDYILGVERRLANLDEYIRRCGGFFGAHRRVDLQYDRVHVE